MLESHLTASPPQRWIGWGYESDPEVWTPEVMKGEIQYWLGDSLLVGGVYEPEKTSARLYLPRKGVEDAGYINLNEPYQYIKSGQWVQIDSPWKNSIPLLARIGSAIVIGKDIQTRSPGDHRFPSPNVFEDDYRALEIFPAIGVSNSTYSYTWYEDDGISSKLNIASFTITYRSTEKEVLVTFTKDRDGQFTPLWKEIDIILPVGDNRLVVIQNTMKQNIVKRKESSRGRAVFTIPTL